MSKGKEIRQLKEISQLFEIGVPLGDGGNAVVVEATNLNTGEKVALKRLVFWNPEKEARFLDEIKVMKKEASAIEGVMPIIDFSEENYWYTMPIATEVMDTALIKSGNVENIVKAFILLLSTLQELHSKNISHRDIKPANIYLINDRLIFGDFGLVDYPDGSDLTQSDRPLGAVFTRAPEMLRDPKNANGKHADVYSMAKTLWMLLTNDDKGFDGQYNEYDNAHRLNRFKQLKNEHLLEIEKLIVRATSTNPIERPTASEFKMGLEEWLLIHGDENLSQVKDWEHLSEILFHGISPEHAVYTGIPSVLKVLDAIIQSPAYNHMFVPNGGGLDLDSVEMSAEEGCIKIHGNGCLLILKPKKLYYRGFNDIRWNYFLLETDELNTVLPPKYNDKWYETVVEDIPGHYVIGDDACYGVYDYDSGEKLPQGWCRADRVLKGKILFVMKLGHYNKISATYDARHCNCSEKEFYELIGKYERVFNEGARRGYSEKQILSLPNFSVSPFVLFEKKDVLPPISISKEYINEHYKEWGFQLPEFGNKKGLMSFYFIFDKGDWDYNMLLEDRELVLGVSGKIVERKVVEEKDVLYVSNRETAFKIEDVLNSQVTTYCKGYDTEYIIPHFKIGWKRIAKPTHLFTKEEMEWEYKNADDRLGNKLIIDEDGYARFVSPHEEGTAYPVCHETFQPRRNCVGKYSSLSTLENDYMESLSAWLLHLQNGIYVYCNGSNYPTIPEGKLINEILKYY